MTQKLTLCLDERNTEGKEALELLSNVEFTAIPCDGIRPQLTVDNCRRFVGVDKIKLYLLEPTP